MRPSARGSVAGRLKLIRQNVGGLRFFTDQRLALNPDPPF